MTVIERTVDTKAPVDTVAAFLSDFATAEQWDPGTVTCRRVDASPGSPPAVGAEYENVSVFRGRQTTLRYKIVDFQPGAHVRLIGENKTVTSIDDLHFEPHADGTRVVYRAEFKFKGLARLAVPFLQGSLKKLGDEGASRMKRTLDGLR